MESTIEKPCLCYILTIYTVTLACKLGILQMRCSLLQVHNYSTNPNHRALFTVTDSFLLSNPGERMEGLVRGAFPTFLDLQQTIICDQCLHEVTY